MAKKKKLKIPKDKREFYALTKHTVTNLEEWFEKYGDMNPEDYKPEPIQFPDKIYQPKHRYVRALQWDGSNYESMCAFLSYRPKLVNRNKGFVVNGNGGTKVCTIGDWLIHDDVFGFDVVKQQAFDKMYEEVDNESST